MIKNLEEVANQVLSSKYDVRSFTINGNSIIVEHESSSHRTTWEGYIDFFDDGTYSATNFMNSPRTGIYANEIASQLIIE